MMTWLGICSTCNYYRRHLTATANEHAPLAKRLETFLWRNETQRYKIFVSEMSNGTNRVPGEIKRREVELDPKVSPEEIMSREVELGCESWTSFASGCSSTAVQRTLSL